MFFCIISKRAQISGKMLLGTAISVVRTNFPDQFVVPRFRSSPVRSSMHKTNRRAAEGNGGRGRKVEYSKDPKAETLLKKTHPNPEFLLPIKVLLLCLLLIIFGVN